MRAWQAVAGMRIALHACPHRRRKVVVSAGGSRRFARVMPVRDGATRLAGRPRLRERRWLESDEERRDGMVGVLRHLARPVWQGAGRLTTPLLPDDFLAVVDPLWSAGAACRAGWRRSGRRRRTRRR